MLEAIRNRRSVRLYRRTPVSDADVEEILKAGFCAPSAHNERPWHIVVVRDQAVRERMAGIHEWSRWIASAPVAVVVAVDRSGFAPFWPEDGAAFTENMMIQATELGLATCWIGIRGAEKDGVHGEDVVRQACGLPEHFGIVAVMTLGYAGRHPGPHESALPEDRVRYIG